MKKITIPILGIVIHMSNDETDTGEFIKKNSVDKNDCDIVDTCDGLSMSFIGTNDKWYRIMCVFDGKLETITHEAVHTSWNVLKVCDIPVTEENNEALAFLAAHLFLTFVKLFKFGGDSKDDSKNNPKSNKQRRRSKDCPKVPKVD